MKSEKVYSSLEKDFINPGLTDDWSSHMGEVQEFLTENFKQRSMGLVCDFNKEITRVYTAVFPSDKVLQKILDSGAKNALLFVHHPSIWDIRKAPQVFQQMNKDLLRQFKERGISIYNLHVPLDNFGEYSTSKTLADALGITNLKPCSPYEGGLAGVIGETKCKTIRELQDVFEKAVGHKINVRHYGDEKIGNGKVVVVAGGGNEVGYLQEAFNDGVKIVVTGISSRNPHSEKNHAYEEKHGINVLGGTHYSTETFACIAMCNYFKKLGLSSEFIKDVPVMEDM